MTRKDNDRKRLQRIWHCMRNRCKGDQESHIKNYVLRGINVCDEWQNNFEAFYNWAINNGYDNSLSIDRINNNEGYSPNNCRWATQKQQMNNFCDNVILTLDGVSHTVSEWSEITNINKRTLYYRKYYGWDDKRILTIPVAKRKISLNDGFAKAVVQKDKNGNIINRYESILEAARLNNILHTSIVNNLKGRSKFCGGYKYEYA